MFHIVRNTSEYGTLDLVERFMVALRTVVPLGVLNQIEYRPDGDRVWDAVLRWDVGRSSVRLALEVKIGRMSTSPPAPTRVEGTIPVLVAPFLAPRVRRELDRAGWSYWDATGNTLLRSEDPLVAVRTEGADKDPDPDARPVARLRSLKGRIASEVIVGLLQNDGRAASIRDFARERNLPLGTVSRVVSLLRDENLLKPTGGGPIVLIDRLDVARRWADDYSFTTTFRAQRYFSVNGPELAVSKILKADVPCAVTGVHAAQNWLGKGGRVSGLPADATWLYVADRDAVERIADLSVDSRGGQIVVAECDFLERERPRAVDGVPYVTPWRITGDLLSAGGRLARVGEQVAAALVEGGGS